MNYKIKWTTKDGLSDWTSSPSLSDYTLVKYKDRLISQMPLITADINVAYKMVEDLCRVWGQRYTFEVKEE